eukprot:CAMPEP_0176109988 /NCGR_PEP_ID=MMETSP0120_2-20121206/55224_1 /TAXON_ID=160619 /ORGANISM="Kryptoperidinium foliaceum, Strain CCMP 1326" /LENGTH=64 /DNA_ID=CAMNT_0017444181 /DNA_START=54 /DNA_END=245 /DNA_ORIENTATION=+
MAIVWRISLALSGVATVASGGLVVRSLQNEQACEKADLQHRSQFQNKLAGACEEMCKEVGAYPK